MTYRHGKYLPVSLEQTILAQHWMLTAEDMDEEDARDLVFAEVGATDDVLGLYDE